MDHTSPQPRSDVTSASDAFLDAFTASVHERPTRALQELLISAVVACAGPARVRAFLRLLAVELTATGPLDDAQRAQWRWLVQELRLMEELDTKRFDDDGVRAVLAHLDARVEGRNDDPDVVLEVENDQATGENAEAGSTSWDAMAKSLRDSSRQTLRRLWSGSGSAPDTRDSVGSTEFPTDASESSRHSRQRHTHPAHNDVDGVAILQRNSSALSDSVPSLLWSISSMIGMNMEETFLCQICYENVPVTDAAQLTVCQHRFCRPCFKTYLELKIVDGQVYPVCFHETEQTTSIAISEPEPDQPNPRQPPVRKACGTPIAPCDIEASVVPDVWKKYLMFKFNKENEYGRQCPYCEASQLCEGPEHPECVCSECGKPFCFVHGKAHADGTCADFELRQAESDKLNRSAIAAISKPCPGCKANVEKSGGCNHMKCVVCSTDFCWICGAVVDSNVAPLHFQWWNIRGCAGQQMEDVDAQSPSERFWMGVVRVAIVVFLGPISLIITLALTLASCCCVPCVAALQLSFRDLFTSCLNFVLISLLLTITGIFMAVTFVCAILWDIICFPCQRVRRARQSTPAETPAVGAPDQASLA